MTEIKRAAAPAGPGHADATKPLDVITIGRSSVDLYGQQIGSRLEDITSFAKSVGGCPSNIADRHRAARAEVRRHHAGRRRADGPLHPRADGARGRRDGGIATDPDRLTALVLLAVEDEGVSPMIFYRTDCADMALSEADIDEGFIASRRGRSSSPARISRAKQRRRAAEGDPHRQGEWRQGRLRHRLPPESLGPRRPCRRLRALCEVGSRLRAA